MKTGTEAKKAISELLEESRAKSVIKPDLTIEPVSYVTDEHQTQMAGIYLNSAVQAHVWGFMPEDDGVTTRTDVVDYIEEMVGPVSHLFMKQNSRGLIQGALASATTCLSSVKGFIQLGGSYENHDDLRWGEWRWAEGAREECRDYIRKNSGHDPEDIINLVEDALFNNQLYVERNEEAAAISAVVVDPDPVVEEPVTKDKEDNWLDKAHNLLDRLQNQVDRLFNSNKVSG